MHGKLYLVVLLVLYYYITRVQQHNAQFSVYLSVYFIVQLSDVHLCNLLHTSVGISAAHSSVKCTV